MSKICVRWEEPVVRRGNPKPHVTIAHQDYLLCKNFKIQTSQINELKLEKPSTDMSQISEKKLPSHSLQSHPKKTSITLHEQGGPEKSTTPATLTDHKCTT
jgi:hypothetical protein